MKKKCLQALKARIWDLKPSKTFVSDAIDRSIGWGMIVLLKQDLLI